MASDIHEACGWHVKHRRRKLTSHQHTLSSIHGLERPVQFLNLWITRESDAGALTPSGPSICLLGTFCDASICISLEVVSIRGKDTDIRLFNATVLPQECNWAILVRTPSAKCGEDVRHMRPLVESSRSNLVGMGRKARITKQPVTEAGLSDYPIGWL